jgi:hypothetical protein
MLYIIAGPSSSGKSSTRSYITKVFGISGIDSDTLRTMTQSLRPDIDVGHTQDVKTNYINMRATIDAFLYARSFFEEDYLLEGDAVNLEDIKKYAKIYNVKCIVLGYPNDTIEERLQVFRQAKDSHWSHKLDIQTLTAKVIDNIEYSKYLEKEAQRLGLPFLEVTSHTSIDKNVRNISNALMK